MAGLHLYLLGSPRLEREGIQIEISRRKAVALLAYLAVTAEPQRRETLATLFWPEYDERRALAYLRRTLWSLKEALGEEWLSAERESLGLVPREDFRLDTAQFRALVSSSQTAQETTVANSATRLARLEEAASLYRGDFMTGFTLPDAPGFDEWQFFQAEGLRQALVLALKELIQEYSAQGNFEEAIPYARRWLSLDALHEPAHQQLMQLYAWTGQQAAALRQYQECARILAEELDTAPSEETNALFTAIKTQRHLSSPVESNQRPAAQVAAPPENVEAILPKPPPLAPNLPPQPTSFVGRETELAALKKLIAQPNVRLITLTGSGGIGKTRLALQAANVSFDTFAGGVFFVPLIPVISARLLIPAIAEALNISLSGPADPRRQLLDHLRRREILLILDNFEHLLVPPQAGLGEGASLLSELVLAAPQVKLLVTSRERLNLQEEWVYELQGMAFPAIEPSPSGIYQGSDPPRLQVEESGNYEALQLFEERARQVKANFDLAAEYAEVVRLCQRVEGLPLGLEMAAAWVKLMSCREIVQEIEQNFDFLATSLRNVPERHRSLRAVFENSWNLLPPEEKTIFKKLSVFCGSFSRQAAEQVAGASLSLLSALVDKSLLQRTRAGRYEIHELLRQYAEEKLEAAPAENEATHAAHAAYYAAFLQQQESRLQGSHQLEALDEIMADIENVRVSWRWAVERADQTLIGQALGSLWFFGEIKGQVREWEAAFRQALERLTGQRDSKDPSLEVVVGRLLARRGYLSLRLGLVDEAYNLARQSLALLKQMEDADRRELAFSFYVLGLTCMYTDPVQSKKLCQESLDLAIETGDQWLKANNLCDLGILAEGEVRYPEASAFLQESIEAFEQLGERRERAFTINALGRIAYALGDYPRARQLFEEALQIRQEFDDLSGQAMSLLALGNLARTLGQLEQADRCLQESVAISRWVGDRKVLADALSRWGVVARLQGKYEQAEQRHQESIAICREVGIPRILAFCYYNLGCLAYDQGDLVRAEELLQACLTLWRQAGREREHSAALCQLGQVALARGKAVDAQAYFRQALELAQKVKAASLALNALAGLASLLLSVEPIGAAPERAVALLALVQHHPASEFETKEKAKHLLTKHAADLPPEIRAGAEARGQALDLWQTAAELQAKIAN